MMHGSSPIRNDRRSWLGFSTTSMNSASPSPSTREIEIRRRVVENRTVVEQGVKISWHPHPTICLLSWWVSEWESTRVKRERLLQLCLGQNGERCGRGVRWSERTKEFGGGRRPTKGRSGKVKERHGCIVNQTKYRRIVANAENWALDQVS
jgi:hypothetical protein